MLLKSCIGDRALGWDLLPPGSKGYEFDNFTYAGYHQSPMKWAVGTTPVPIGWAAGVQYDGDIFRANNVLSNISTFYPSTPFQKCYEVAGFFWWQGDKDSRDMGLSTHYEENLVALIKQLRVQYDAPTAKVTTPAVQSHSSDTRKPPSFLSVFPRRPLASNWPVGRRTCACTLDSLSPAMYGAVRHGLARADSNERHEIRWRPHPAGDGKCC